MQQGLNALLLKSERAFPHLLGCLTVWISTDAQVFRRQAQRRNFLPLLSWPATAGHPALATRLF
jgi:hypothetical protein